MDIGSKFTKELQAAQKYLDTIEQSVQDSLTQFSATLLGTIDKLSLSLEQLQLAVKELPKLTDSLQHPPTLTISQRREQYLDTLVKVQHCLLSCHHLQDGYTDITQLLGKATEASRVYIFEKRVKPGEGDNNQLLLVKQAEWCSPDISAQIDHPVLASLSYQEYSPLITEILEKGEVFSAIVADLPEFERQFLKEQEVQSILILPLMVKGQLFGLIGFDNCQESQLWQESEVFMLQAAATAISLKIENLQTLSALQASEEALRESEARFRAIFDHAAVGIGQATPRGELLKVNQKYCELLGYTCEELSQLTWQAISHPADLETELPYVEQLLTGEITSFFREKRFRRKDGSYLWANISGSLVHDSQGLPKYTIGIIQDISERKRVEAEKKQALEQQLHQSQYQQLCASLTLKIRQSLQIQEILQTTVSELQKTLEADRVLFFRLFPDASGKVISEAVVSGFTVMLEQAIIDECCRDRCFEKYREGYVHVCNDVETAKLHPCYLEFLQKYQIRANLIVPVILSISEEENLLEIRQPVPYPIWGLLCIQQCSTSRDWKQLEIELLQQLANQISIALYQAHLLEQETQRHQELTRSNAELEQFAYVASHDLQEPLNTVSSYAQLLARRYQGKLDNKADRFIHHLVDSSERMQQLLKDLLDYSRVGRKQKTFEQVDCNLALEDAIANLKHTIRKNQAQVNHSSLPTVIADFSQLVQLWQNLIGNAIKYRREESPVVQVSATLKGDVWLFSVCDNGIGIDPKHVERIFLIFQRLHTQEEYPGTGIGLAICHRIVERHGGRIWVESVLGQGSAFYFTLPLQNFES
ncbi:MAG: GAF domain-containing protein [Coleofasciculaceae cyanobacterium]